MNKRKQGELVRRAVDARLSGLAGDPWLAQRILANAKGEIKVKKKISVGFVLVLVLALAAVTALAAALLSAKEVVEQQAVPMAQQNDAETLNEQFSNAELAQIIKLAQENGIAIPDRLMLALEGGQGYWEQEVIMALAKSEFGPVYDQWTLEQQYWFGEVMVAIGFRETNPSRLPGEGEISLDQAMSILKACILEEYSDDVSDTATWVRYATYGVNVNDEGEAVSPASWFFQFQPTDVKHNEYMLTMDSTGKITSMDVREAPDGGYGADVIRQYQAVYGGFRDWTPEVWAALGKDLKGLSPLTLTAWAFQNAGYILPPEGGITFEQAGETALASVHLDYTTVSGGVCCMAGDKAIWKIETLTMRPEDIGSGKYTAIWLVEIDCMTGEVLEKREFVVGSDAEPLTSWIPWSVYENLPPMPAGPNG